MVDRDVWMPLTVLADGRSRDLHIQVSADSTVRDLAEALALHLNRHSPMRLLSERGYLALEDGLAAAGVCAGIILTVADALAGTRDHHPKAARRELRVVG